MDAPWTRHYAHGGAWERAFEALTVPDLLLRSAARAPDAPCLDFLGRRWSYRAVAEAARRAGAGFAALGAGPGRHVGLFLPNCPHYVFAYYGALMAGATVVNFSPLYTADELVLQVEDSGVELMVTLDLAQLYPTIAAVLGRTRIAKLVVGNLPEVLPWGKALGYRLLRGKDRAQWTADARHMAFADLIAAAPLEAPVAIDPVRDVALLQYTGGTTGVPKGAVLTHANLTINAQQVMAADPEPEAPDRILGVLPFFHVFANTCVLNRTILHGGEIVMQPRFEAKAVLAAIGSSRITAMPGVPTMYAALLDAPGIGSADFSSLRICISGGAPLPAELRERFEARTGARLIEGYGLTETSGVLTANPFDGAGRAGSVGQPLPSTRVKLVDKDDPSRDPPPGEPGEVVAAGPQIMRGYHNRAAADAEVFVTDGQGTRWLRTGDVGRIDADGYLFIVDRLKDMIVVGGFKVFPSIVEAVLYRHPAVREALVIGVPDARQGERPKAFVTLGEGAGTTADELLHFVNGHVGKHERLVAVELRDALPKTAVGKLSRKELVAEERAKAGLAKAAADGDMAAAR